MRKIKWTDKQNFYVPVDMFKVDVVFVLNCNKAEFLKRFKMIARENFIHFKDEMIDGWDDDLKEGRMIPFRGGYIVLVKNRDDNFSHFVSVLVHEITHVTHYLLRDKGIPLNEDTQEVYCYLTEYLTEQALLNLHD